MSDDSSAERTRKPAKKRRPRSAGPRVEGGSRDARKIAVLVLEVLGGQRTPTDAATALGVSTTRYYGLESQALEGLVTACEPRRRGPGKSMAKEVERLKRQVDHLEKELARRQALLRLSHRAVGIPAARPTRQVPANDAKDETKRKRRRKRATARALRAARQLRQSDAVVLPAQPSDDTSG